MQLWHSCSPDLEARKEAANSGRRSERRSFGRRARRSFRINRARGRPARRRAASGTRASSPRGRTHPMMANFSWSSGASRSRPSPSRGPRASRRVRDGVRPEPGRLRGGGDGGREDRDAGARGARGADSHGGEDTRRRGGGGHRGCSCALRCAGEELTRYLLIESFHDVAPPRLRRATVEDQKPTRAASFFKLYPASRARSLSARSRKALRHTRSRRRGRGVVIVAPEGHVRHHVRPGARRPRRGSGHEERVGPTGRDRARACVLEISPPRSTRARARSSPAAKPAPSPAAPPRPARCPRATRARSCPSASSASPTGP